jgi:hypothetical protein
MALADPFLWFRAGSGDGVGVGVAEGERVAVTVVLFSLPGLDLPAGCGDLVRRVDGGGLTSSFSASSSEAVDEVVDAVIARRARRPILEGLARLT